MSFSPISSLQYLIDAILPVFDQLSVACSVNQVLHRVN